MSWRSSARKAPITMISKGSQHHHPHEGCQALFCAESQKVKARDFMLSLGKMLRSVSGWNPSIANCRPPSGYGEDPALSHPESDSEPCLFNLINRQQVTEPRHEPATAVKRLCLKACEMTLLWLCVDRRGDSSQSTQQRPENRPSNTVQGRCRA